MYIISLSLSLSTGQDGRVRQTDKTLLSILTESGGLMRGLGVRNEGRKGGNSWS